MPGSPNTSFIPKHTSNKTEYKNVPRQLFIGTILVRIFFFAVLVSAAGVFIYERKLGFDLSAEVATFKEAARTFESEEGNVARVLSMDTRLTQANDRFSKSLSMVAILDALDRATIKTVELDSLEIEKKSDTEITMNAKIMTDTFDSVIFQRSIYEESEVLRVTKFEEVTVNQNGATDVPTTPGALSIKAGGAGVPTISFVATVEVDPRLIPAVMDRAAVQPVSSSIPVVVDSPQATSTSTSSSTESTLTPNSDNS